MIWFRRGDVFERVVGVKRRMQVEEFASAAIGSKISGMGWIQCGGCGTKGFRI
jgi:hypothetical protein